MADVKSISLVINGYPGALAAPDLAVYSPDQQWPESGLNFSRPLYPVPRAPGERAGLLGPAKS